MKTLILIGIIILCFNQVRFILGNYGVWKSKEIKLFLKIDNAIETLLTTTSLIYLIIYYYQ